MHCMFGTPPRPVRFTPAVILEGQKIAARAVIASNPIPTPAEYDAELLELDTAYPVC